MRAFARDLGLSPSVVSHVLRGEKNISLALALKVAERLGLGSREKEFFCLLVQFEAARSPALKLDFQSKLAQYSRRSPPIDLQLELFRAISQWHHVAILALAQAGESEIGARTLAKRLGITQAEASGAIDRMLRLGLLKNDHGGSIRAANDDYVARSPIPNEALRSFHRQMLTKAAESLEKQTPSEKLVGSETFTLDPALVPRVNELAEEFFSKVVNLSKVRGNRSQVYHLGVQCFRLTQE